jgi:hypothetical protein
VPGERRETRLDFPLDSDRAAEELGLEQGERLFDEAGDGDALDRARSLAREVEQAVDDARRAERLTLDLAQRLVARVGGIELGQEHLGVRADSRQRVFICATPEASSPIEASGPTLGCSSASPGR